MKRLIHQMQPLIIVAGIICSNCKKDVGDVRDPIVASSVTTLSQTSDLSSEQAESLALEFFQQATEIHFTSSSPDLPDTRVIENLSPCQVKPLREMTSARTRRFSPKHKYFMGRCENGDFSMLSIHTETQTVRMVAMQPHIRGIGSEWDALVVSPDSISTAEDAKAYTAMFYRLRFQIDLSPASMTARPKKVDGVVEWEVTAHTGEGEHSAVVSYQSGEGYRIGSYATYY